MIRILVALVTFSLAGVANAQDAAPVENLSLQLNALQQAENSCRVSFVAFNGLEATLERAAFEIALFDRSGAIDQLVTLDFKQLPGGKTKVLQFELPSLDCADIGRVLINDVSACEGEGVAPKACLEQLETTTTLDVMFGI